jgi:hypothetical protein
MSLYFENIAQIFGAEGYAYLERIVYMRSDIGFLNRGPILSEYKTKYHDPAAASPKQSLESPRGTRKVSFLTEMTHIPKTSSRMARFFG